MDVYIKNRRLYFHKYNETEFQWLKDKLTWVKKWGKTETVETLLFYHNNTPYTFYGLLPVLQSSTKKHKFNLLDADEVFSPVKKSIDPGILGDRRLFDFQVAAVEKALLNKKGIIQIPTGGGKTLVALSILKYLYQNQLIENSLIIVPSKPLASQFKTRAIESGFLEEDVGIVHGSEKQYERPITVSVINSLNSGIKSSNPYIVDILQKAKLVTLDECIPGNQYILTKNGPMSASRLYSNWKKGEECFCFSYNNITKSFEYKKIIYAWKKPIQDRKLIKIYIGKKKVVTTDNHKYLTTEGYISASNLKLGDRILGIDDKEKIETQVTKKENISIDRYLEKRIPYVYDFEVEDNHNFIICGNFTKSGVIVHNCHHAKAETWRNIFDHIPNAEYIHCFSATPFHNEDILKTVGDAAVFGLTGGPIFQVGYRHLREIGLIANLVVLFIRLPGKFSQSRAPFNRVYNKYIVKNELRNKKIVEYINKFNRLRFKNLTLVQRKEHAENLLEKVKTPQSICVFGNNQGIQFDEQGHSHPCSINYDQLLEDFEKGIYTTSIASQVYDEGVDLPSLGAVIQGAGTKSRIKITQRTGRGLRGKKKGPNTVYLIDFKDHSHVYLYSHYNKRRKIYEDMEAVIVEDENVFWSMIFDHIKERDGIQL